ncbi:MAG: alanine--tRNA ligase [Aerococcus sp.]|nr:alanine--tRNA ligase [Aerococcus sp.]
MEALTSQEIRTLWLKFWESKGHNIVKSASLVPHNDPTLLWINSGVAAIKHYLDGSEVPENPRIANVQKCIRTNDIDNVGHTARHQTLFEMLGNWSIGDYFKAEMLPWAWEFLTGEEWLHLDPSRLYMTYYPDDVDTHRYWQEATGLSEEHFIPLEDNIWDLGAGPSGPDTEIFFDRGEKFQNLPDDDPEMYPGGENERYLEIWNIVFSQWNHMPDDTYEDLKHKNIDTGMGLERMASVMQETPTNFETDLFMPIIHAIEALSDNIHYGDDPKTDVSFKVIADHARAVSFAIGDDALPSNEGRGYVLRRLLRRGVMHGRKLGIQRTFLADLLPIIIDSMGEAYPEIVTHRDVIRQVLTREEERFQATIEDGEKILMEKMDRLKAEGQNELPGGEAFQLFDTYGFPLELTEEMLRDEGFSVDQAGFNEAMQAQKERARAARKKMGGLAVQSTVLGEIDVPSVFVGYTEDTSDATINALVHEDQLVQEVPADTVVYLVTDKTPFYGERGGQVGDTGMIYNDNGDLVGRVIDTQHAPNDQPLHEVETLQPLTVGQTVRLVVDSERRRLIKKNHTATHMLHQALKEVLGDNVNQAGSLLDDHYLRFDFTYFGQVSAEELQKVEDIVNTQILNERPVTTTLTTVEEAKAKHAMALFGNKYDKLGENVRLVNIDHWSLELCGGTHVKNTAEIGLFVITQETSVGSGVRRIEALTSKAAINYYQKRTQLLQQIATEVKASQVSDILPRLEQQDQQLKALEREVESLHQKANHQAANQLLEDVKRAGHYQYIAASLPNRTMDDLRHVADEWKQREASDVLVLATANDDKANLLVAVKPSAVTSGLKAGDLIKPLAKRVGGGGGGRPDMAQAGGKNPAGIPDALALVEELLQEG